MSETEDDERPRRLIDALAPLIAIGKLLLYGIVGAYIVQTSWRAGVLSNAVLSSGLSPDRAEAWAWLNEGVGPDGQTVLTVLAAFIVLSLLLGLAAAGPRALLSALQDMIIARPIFSMFCSMILLAIVVFTPNFGVALAVGLVALLILGPLLLRLITLSDNAVWSAIAIFVAVFAAIAAAGFVIGATSAGEPDEVVCRAGETVSLKSGETVPCIKATAQAAPWMFLETEAGLRLLRGSDLEKSPVVVRFYNHEFDK